MELAVQIAGAHEVTAGLTLRQTLGWEKSAVLRPYLDEFASRLPDLPVHRYYIGTEFCENLLPSLDSVREVAALGVPLSLLTPYASNRGLAAMRPLFEALPEAAEVIFADWGVLNVLRRDYPHLVPVQGRLLNKSLRDPRVTGLYGIEGNLNPTVNAMQRSNLDNESYASFLLSMGVTRVEMDQLPQGTSYELGSQDLAAHVYAPFGFISTARSCMAAGLHYRGGDKFQPGAPCRHECQTHLLEYTYTNSPFENQSQRFWLKGNTYFYTHTEDMLRDWANSGVSRLVFQPRLPMVAS